MTKGEPILRPDQVPTEVVEEYLRLEQQVGAADYGSLAEAADLLSTFIEQNNLTTTFIRTVQNLRDNP
jgi:hypothetical protein